MSGFGRVLDRASKNLADNNTQTEKEDFENRIELMPDDEYKSLILRYPDILKLNFNEEFTKNGVMHRILTGDSQPCRAKCRPLLPGSPKEVAAKKAWEALVELGIVELVDPAKSNLWTSALHFPPKPGNK